MQPPAHGAPPPPIARAAVPSPRTLVAVERERQAAVVRAALAAQQLALAQSQLASLEHEIAQMAARLQEEGLGSSGGGSIEEGIPVEHQQQILPEPEPEQASRPVARLFTPRPRVALGELSRGAWARPPVGWPCTRVQAALRRLAFGGLLHARLGSLAAVTTQASSHTPGVLLLTSCLFYSRSGTPTWPPPLPV